MTQPGTVPDWWVCIQTYVSIGRCLQTHTHTHTPIIRRVKGNHDPHFIFTLSSALLYKTRDF